MPTKNADPTASLGSLRRHTRAFALATTFAACALVAALLPPVWRLSDGLILVEGEAIGPQQEDWRGIERVSRAMIDAILVAEDARYFEHAGVDLREVWLSIHENWQAGSYARGASTITQQVIKLAFLGHEKTLLRKLREAAGALVAEQLYSKEEILAWYLNLADFGRGCRGIGRAAACYFETTAELLTLTESTHLALVLPSPNRYAKGLRRRALTRFGHRRYRDILNKLLRGGYITEAQWQHSLATGDFGSPIAHPRG